LTADREDFSERNAGRVSVRLFEVKYTDGLVGGSTGELLAPTVGAIQLCGQQSRLVLRTDATGRIRLGFTGKTERCECFGSKASRGEALPGLPYNLVYTCKLHRAPERNEPKRVRERGKTITPYGQSTVREASAILERFYGKKMAFLTLTCPGDTPEVFKALAGDSDWFQDVFLKAMRRALGPQKYIWIWELQERGALHAHVLVPCPSQKVFNKLWVRHRRWWVQALESYSDEHGVDMFATPGGTYRGAPWGGVVTECKWVRRRVGTYLAKYMSKGSGLAEAVQWWAPKRWWSVSDSLMRDVKAERKRVDVVFNTPGGAREAWERLSSQAATVASWVGEIRNPFSDAVCGSLYYFDEVESGAVFDELVAVARGVVVPLPAQPRAPPTDGLEAAASELFGGRFVNFVGKVHL